jgi:hypothetical protein
MLLFLLIFLPILVDNKSVDALIDLSFDPVHGNISTGFEESITKWATIVLGQELEVGSIL